MIKSVHLDCFKNFRDAELPLGPLTVLVGTNASGKSNVRDAFRFLHGIARGYSIAEIIGEKYGEGGVLQWTGIRGGTAEIAFYGENVFSITTVVQTILWPVTHRISIAIDNRRIGPRVVQESLYFRDDELIFDSHPKDEPPQQTDPEHIVVSVPSDSGPSINRRTLRFQSSVPVVSQFSRLPDEGMYSDTAGYYLTALSLMRFLDLSPSALRSPSFPGQVVLGDRGENLSSVLQAICSNDAQKRAMLNWLRQLTPLDVIDVDFVSDQIGRVLLTLVEADGKRTSAYSASDGTLRFLGMLAAFMGPESNWFYFLEELDNGIHPTRIGLLLQLIEQHSHDSRTQIIATTHSPQLLALLSPESREHALLVYRLEHEADGHIQRIMDIPSAREVLEEQNLARLHESGWLENVIAFSQPEETGA